MDKKRSWACTLAVQVFLCIATYISLNLGEPHNFIYHSGDGSTSIRPVDAYFLSVRGGYRSIKRQTHLLKLMENVAKAYKAKFVVNISELGEEDPLTRNASGLFSSMNISWYTTRASKGSKVDCFLKQINVTHGKMLTVSGLDTKSLQDLMLAGSTSSFGNNESNWLTQTLEAATESWLMVVGYDPVVVCEEKEEQTEAQQLYEPLHHIFLKYGVNVYLSTQGCVNHTFQGGVAYIGIADPNKSKPYEASLNGSSAFQGEMDDGFLLHRVGSLEIATYFVTSRGEVVYKNLIQQGGKEIM
ncbi:hypothetical protein JCGZ_04007 [Jatropha curcas]|uniref:Uncharacterized protein n=1 Tax=Jatropha curcas TaxID=180498 RepID=A0A067L3J3_JATCU|nr:uncharacterized protein LOC105633486 [Jatropha curcas]XP_037493105.1 uncharacterized protein LOC105633486 [Jatropha curcas]KDP38654.1 hypothetical protein JCGZ_04007 [Jatropha curcas]